MGCGDGGFVISENYKDTRCNILNQLVVEKCLLLRLKYELVMVMLTNYDGCIGHGFTYKDKPTSIIPSG